MKTNIESINIPQPCNQPWQEMAPVGGGRHCESCCKTVTDFTLMTDAEIITYLVTKNNVCGRFNEPQLNRVNLQLNGQDTKTSPGWKKWVMTTALLGSTLLYKASGQIAPVEQSLSQSYPASPAKTKRKIAAVKESEREIKGRIVDDACVPLHGATVRVVGTNIVLPTDTNGRFKFHAPIAARQFTVSFVGFETETVDIDNIRDDIHEVKLMPQVISMNDVVVIPAGYQAERRTSVVGSIAVVTTRKYSWLWRMYYKYIRTPIHNIFY